MGEKEIRVLLLNENDDKSEELFRLKKDWIVQIKVSSLLSHRKVRIFVNICLNKNEKFQRDLYKEFKWICPSNSKYDDSDRYVQIEFDRSGSFHYYFTIDGTTKRENCNGQGYFQVQSDLIPQDGIGQIIEQDAINCQSVLSKCLGEIVDWSSRLELSKECGYNLIHFTPIQLLYSGSNSSYSITNHHKLNPMFKGTFEQVKQLIDKLCKESNIYSITDLVYNHVANDCCLIHEHPECCYNLENSPHLKSAVLLDSILIELTRDAEKGKLKDKGIPEEIKQNDLESIRNYLNEKIKKYRFNEFYICDSDRLTKQFEEKASQLKEFPLKAIDETARVELEHGNYLRMKSRVNLELAIEKFCFKRNSDEKAFESLNLSCLAFRSHINYLNELISRQINEHLDCAINNCLASCRYHFFSFQGPKYSRLSFPNSPFVGNYFLYPNNEFINPDEINERIENDVEFCRRVMAHNGWVMNDNPLTSFAEEGQNVYLRRELIEWSDIVKLRFGNNRDDCPFLFSYFQKYTEIIATTFHGCRLDNCHSTPLWFGQQMMDFARQINPNFYVNAELFTGNVKTDIRFINQIGINSLVRESYRSFDPHELAENCRLYSDGDPIGSFFQLNVRPLIGTKPFCLFYDQTHDNPCQIQQRSVEDLLPRSAVVAMANCSTGSTRGYDELIPHHIDVVQENRFYQKWTDEIKEKKTIIQMKKSLNKLHKFIAQQHFSQLKVDQLTESILLITRFNPLTVESILLICFTSFNRPKDQIESLPDLFIQFQIQQILLECSLKHFYEKESIEHFQRSTKLINGLEQNEIYFKENCSIDQSLFIRFKSSNCDGSTTISFTDKFIPGSILILRLNVNKQIRQSLNFIQNTFSELCQPKNNFSDLIEKLNLVDLQRILYRPSNEEKADGKGFDVYSIPNFGDLVYSGLQGQINIFNQIRFTNSIEHPIIDNLKQGNWLMNYISNRLQIHQNTKELANWFEMIFEQIGSLPRFLIPMFFHLILNKTYELLIERSYSLLSPFVVQSSSFVKALSQTSVQLLSIVRDARLPLLSPNLREPRPIQQIDEETFEQIQQCPSLAAGFPHFSAGIWRNWGRDTFISLRGLLLLTGRFDEARFLILSYGQCLRHGLIPNLLSDGKNARFNCRDAVWWWIYSIQNYTNSVIDGFQILSDKVSRLYPTNESPIQNCGCHDQSLFDVIHEVLLRHLQCLTFRERGAGYSLDEQMNDEGFNNQIGIDLKTGFVFGGNRWNCGTWMDKMGSSLKAENKGHPATPRDGSAIEIIALSRSIIHWLIQMNKDGHYPYDHIETSSNSGGKTKLFLIDWLNKIDENFEKEFWIKESDQSKFVHRKLIYKDTINSSNQWTDFQLRPNFLIAAVIVRLFLFFFLFLFILLKAPQMFDKDHIWLALEQVQNILLGKLGIKTLDPNDFNYVGNYSNDDDSNDYKRARGFNYHNGPEWLWLTGYYIRAKIYWAKKQENDFILKETIKHVRQLFSFHMDLIFSNDWKGLPELTNENGQKSSYSCFVQSWSSATIIEAFYDLIKT